MWCKAIPVYKCWPGFNRVYLVNIIDACLHNNQLIDRKLLPVDAKTKNGCRSLLSHLLVIPAKAGIQWLLAVYGSMNCWIPASAGMT